LRPTKKKAIKESAPQITVTETFTRFPANTAMLIPIRKRIFIPAGIL